MRPNYRGLNLRIFHFFSIINKLAYEVSKKYLKIENKSDIDFYVIQCHRHFTYELILAVCVRLLIF